MEAFADEPHTPTCCVCLEEKDYNGSALVRCAACALAVHVRCYGTSLPGDNTPWRCEACQYEEGELPDEPSLIVDANAHATATAAGEPRLRPRCVVCPVEGGALRRTNQPGVWVHVLCVNWIPELSHSRTGELNQAVNIALLDRSRETLRCLVCGQRGGCIQCVSGRCARAFHVLCAIRSPSSLIFTGYNGANQQVYHCKAHLADVAAAKYELVDTTWRETPRMQRFLDAHPVATPAADAKCRVCHTKTGSASHDVHETQCLLAWLTREELKHRMDEMKKRGLKAATISYATRSGHARKQQSSSKGASPATKKQRQHATTRPCPECGDTVRDTMLAAHLKSGCAVSANSSGHSSDTRRSKKNPKRLKRKMSANDGLSAVDEPLEPAVASDLSDVLFATWPGQHAGASMDTTTLWRTVNSSFFSSKALMKKRMEQVCKSACGAKLEDIGNLIRKPTRHDLVDCADTVLLERMVVPTTTTDGEGVGDDRTALCLKAHLHRCDFVMRASRTRCVEDVYAQPSLEIRHVGAAARATVEEEATPATALTLSTATLSADLTDDGTTQAIRVRFANNEDVAVDCKYAMTLSRSGSGAADKALPPADDGLFWSAFQHDELSTLAGADVEAFRVPLGQDDRLWLSMEMMPGADDNGTPATPTPTTSNLPGRLLLPAASDERSLTDELTPEISLLMETLNEQMKQNRFRLRALSKKLQLTDHVEGLARRAGGVTEAYYKEYAAWKRLCKSLTTGYKDIRHTEAATESLPTPQKSTASPAGPSDNTDNNNDTDEPIDDGTCVVCFDGQSPESNPIVFCDRCDLAVHQGCYGLVTLPNNEFFCDRCSIEDRGEDPASSVFCQLCSLRDGAFKRTVDGKWVHVVCALWCPKVWIGNLQSLSEINLVAATSPHVKFVDPVAEVSARLALPLPVDALKPSDEPTNDRVALTQGSLCRHCKVACGRTIQCAHPDCTASFHPLCGWYEGLSMTIALSDRGFVYAGGGAGLRFAMHCEAHLPSHYSSAERLVQRRRRRKFRIDAFYLTQCKLDRRASPPSARKAASTRHESSLLSGPILQALLAGDRKRSETTDDDDTVADTSDSDDWVDRPPCSACFQFRSPVIAEPLDVNALHKRQFLMRCQYCNTFVHPECCLSETGALATIFTSNWICERCTMVGDATPTPCVVCDKPTDYLMPCSSSSAGVPPVSVGATYDKWAHVFCAKWAKVKLVRKNRVLCAQAPSLSPDGHAFRCELCSLKGVRLSLSLSLTLTVLCRTWAGVTLSREGRADGLALFCCVLLFVLLTNNTFQRNLASCAHCPKRFHPFCAAKKRLYIAKSAKQEWKFYCDAHPPSGVVYDERRQSWMTTEILSQLQDLRRSLERGRMILEMSRQRDRQQKRILNVYQLPFMAASLEIVLKKRPTPAMREAFEALTGDVLTDTPRRVRPQRAQASSRTRARASESHDDTDDEEEPVVDPPLSTRPMRGKRQQPVALASSGTSSKRRRLELDIEPESPPSSPAAASNARRRPAARAKPATSAAHDLRDGLSPTELKRRFLSALDRATTTSAFDGVVAELYPELAE